MNYMINGDDGNHPFSPKYSPKTTRVDYGEDDYDLINERGEDICPICGKVCDPDYDEDNKCLCDEELVEVEEEDDEDSY